MTRHAELDESEAESLELALNWPQTQALDALKPDHAIVLAWGRGVGKSFALRLTWYLLVALAEAADEVFEDLACSYELDESLVAAFRRLRKRKKPGVRIVVLGPTRKQLVDIHGADLRHDLEQGDWAWLGGVINRTVWSVEFPGGSTIRFLGMDGSVRGVRADAITPDECDDILIPEYDAVAAPLLSATWSLGIEMFGGTPIRGRFGLLYRQFKLGETSDNVTSIHATYRDVPETVKLAAVEKERERVSTAIFQREWECNFDAGEGRVYDFFVDDAYDPETGRGHILSPDPHAIPTEVLVGVDWGYEHPGTMIEVAVYGKGADAEAYVVSEVYQSARTLQYWEGQAARIRARCKQLGWPEPRFFADPSKPADIKQIRANARVDIRPAKNSVEEGISTVAYWLWPRALKRPCRRHALTGKGEVDLECRQCTVVKRPRLFVGAQCKNLRREFGLYRRQRDSKNKEQFHDAVEKTNDDAQDGLRYALFTRFGLPRTLTHLGKKRLVA